MSFEADDRIFETSVTVGAGTYTLDGAQVGFQPFSVLTANNYTCYFASDDVNWECGIGQVLAGPARLTRATILASSNGGAAVNWGGGTIKIRCGMPAALAFPQAIPRAGNTILGVADLGKTIVATGTWSQTFEAVATLGDRWWCGYRNDGTGVITLDPDAAETVDGAATIALQPGDSCLILCTGASLKTVGRLNANNPAVAKAWVQFAINGTIAASGSYNVTSITDSGTGNWTVNFTTAFGNANYAASFIASNNSTNTPLIPFTWTPAAGSCTVRTSSASAPGTLADAEDSLKFIAFGAQ